MDSLEQLVCDAAPSQRERYSHTPGKLIGAAGKFKFIAFMTLMGQAQLGGNSWLLQFTWGFPITGDLSQRGVCPTDKTVDPSPDPNLIWPNKPSDSQQGRKAQACLTHNHYGPKHLNKWKMDG